ncbi:hypothetical protein [Leptospira weilii]|uniref:hypothetical protein n=1 Tax=Leptospira weilii TaxID=28184 RepID=UPI0012DA2CC0|nr:hypothetical protein [Leptospira weilii]
MSKENFSIKTRELESIIECCVVVSGVLRLYVGFALKLTVLCFIEISKIVGSV